MTKSMEKLQIYFLSLSIQVSRVNHHVTGSMVTAKKKKLLLLEEKCLSSVGEIKDL